MPELPEVENTRKALWKYLEDKKIKKVLLNRSTLRFPIPQTLYELENDYFIDHNRHGKYIFLDTHKGNRLLVHLGMSGKFLTGDDLQKNPDKHQHIIFTFTNHSQIAYYDPRRFGYIDFYPLKKHDTNRFITKLGIDALTILNHIDLFANTLHKKSTSIKQALLDQSILAGMGNIYVSEALWRAKIHPLHKSNLLTKEKITELCHHIYTLLQEAIQAGGSTLKDYKKPDGSIGGFQKKFAVYNQPDHLCHRQDGGIIQKIMISGRSSFFCPICQKRE